MNRLLVEYCKSRLADSDYKQEYKEVTNSSFAKFIVDVAECLMILEGAICSLLA